MVKRQARGTGYNTGGADGWEWWSVQDLGNCNIERLWRGPVAQGGESYTNTPAGDCNGCHGRAVANDYVWDDALQLSKFLIASRRATRANGARRALRGRPLVRHHIGKVELASAPSLQ